MHLLKVPATPEAPPSSTGLSGLTGQMLGITLLALLTTKLWSVECETFPPSFQLL
jgi:hypothetical protein